ncbi:MAG: glycosyltransferase [Victivallaceae bacterium]|nr:glycosyltransferase [Victivallaceae bacterium]
MKELTMFTRYSALGASSRYRFFLYADRWGAAGGQATIFNFFDDRYLRRLYQNQKAGFFSILSAYLRRFRALLRGGDDWLIEYELLPFLPYRLEKIFLAHRRYILNFDDNVWEKYQGKRLLSGKYDALARHAAGIIVANDFLYERLSGLNKNIIKIPTAVDLDLYQTDKPKFDQFTLVWIGTPVTYLYLEKHAAILRRLAEKYDFELLVIARKALAERRIAGVKMRFEDWAPERETELLLRSHVGIMPLTDDDFSRGKSAFKLIQYAAAGLPAIASPVGENVKIVENCRTGFLAASENEWLEALDKLINDKRLYSAMAAAAREASADYSIRKYFPVFRDFVENSAK